MNLTESPERIVKAMRGEEKRRAFSISFAPSFHEKMKAQAAAENVSLSKFIEDIVGPELEKRHRIRDAFHRAVDAREAKVREEFKDSIVLSKDNLKAVRGYKHLSSEQATNHFIRLGVQVEGYASQKTPEGYQAAAGLIARQEARAGEKTLKQQERAAKKLAKQVDKQSDLGWLLS